MFAKSLEIEVGPVPFEEECAQVGTADYAARSTLECAIYIRQLQRIFGHPDPAKLTSSAGAIPMTSVATTRLSRASPVVGTSYSTSGSCPRGGITSPWLSSPG